MNKKLLIIIAVIVVGGVGGYFGFYYWSRTPGFAINNIRSAINGRDLESFRAGVDLDQVLDRGLAALWNAAGDQPSTDLPGKNVSKNFVQVLSPFLVSQGKNEIETWVQTGTWKNQSEPAATPKPGDPVLDLADIGELQFQAISSTEWDDNAARVGLAFHHARYNADLQVELVLEPQADGCLRAVEIANLPALIGELSNLEQNWRDKQDQPAREKLERSVQITGLDKRTTGGAWVMDQKNHLWITVKNTSDQTMNSLAGELRISVKQSTPPPTAPPKDLTIAFTDMDLKPGEEKTFPHTFPVGRFDQGGLAIFAAGPADLEFTFTPHKLAFANGPEIALLYY